MPRRILIFDTSILCCWLSVPGKSTAGSGSDRYDFEQVQYEINRELAHGTTFVLPLAAIIETGNHIAQTQNCFDLASRFAELILKALDQTSPWAAFSDQAHMWSDERLRNLIQGWPIHAASKQSLGDASIADVSKYYRERFENCEIKIFTADKSLKSFEPAPPSTVLPRRREF